MEKIIYILLNDYPAFFQHDNLYSFFKSMFDVHVVMTKKFVGAKPPILKLEPISKKEAMFSYNSSRGMFDYFLGLIDGSSEYYKEKLEVIELERTDTNLKLKLVFEKDIFFKKRYVFNKILSLGFIKNISVKAALFTFIITSLGLIPIINMDNNIASIFLGALVAGLSAFISVALLNMPKKEIFNELKHLQKNIYAEDGAIETRDFLKKCIMK